MTSGGSERDGFFTISPARYAKGMVKIEAPSTDGRKTRAARLADSLARGRYTGREKAYILSPSAARRFEKLYAEGWDASVLTRELKAPA